MAEKLDVWQGTLALMILKTLQALGPLHGSSEWGQSDNNRRAKYYKLTRAGRKFLDREERDWEQTTAILARFLAAGKEPA